jgi:hypothetical protein
MPEGDSFRQSQFARWSEGSRNSPNERLPPDSRPCFTNGKKFRIGTDEPDKLLPAIVAGMS